MNRSTVSAPNFFDEGSPFLKHPLLTAERTTQEIEFLERALHLGPGARILDVGCGFGRHTIELAYRGYAVTGIDPSAAMIAAARKRAVEAGAAVDFRQVRGENFSTDELYDGAICLFTTLGQISERGDNSGLIDNIYASLKRGAFFAVEVPQRDTAVNQLKEQESFGEGVHKTYVSRGYDAQTQILSEEFRIVTENGETTYLLRYKLYDSAQLERGVAEAGFTDITAYGDFQGSSLTPEHGSMLFVAKKER